MELQERTNQINRLNDCIEDYKKKSGELNDLLFSVYRLRNEIKILCDNLGIDVKVVDEDEGSVDENEQ